MWRAVLLAGFLTCGLAGSAHAQFLQEVRFGVLAHNISIGLNPGNENQEDGENIQAELVFKTPRLLDRGWLGRPRPYLVGSVNTAGNTSFGGFGLNWQFRFRKKWAFEPSLGYIIHTGAIDLPFPIGDPANTVFDENNILFGSRDLFRTGIAFNRDFGERWGTQIIYEHLSHGQILGSGRNQGNDSVGVRVFYKFGKRRERLPELDTY